MVFELQKIVVELVVAVPHSARCIGFGRARIALQEVPAPTRDIVAVIADGGDEAIAVDHFLGNGFYKGLDALGPHAD